MKEEIPYSKSESKIRHREFPRHLAWLMTIVKAKGQGFEKVGIQVTEPYIETC